MKNLLDIIMIISIIPAVIFFKKLRHMKVDIILIIMSIANVIIAIFSIIWEIMFKNLSDISLFIWMGYILVGLFICSIRIKEEYKEEKEKLKRYKEEIRDIVAGENLPIIDVEFEESECE